MGNIITAYCKYCKYTTDRLSVGSGQLDYPSCCSYPVLDREKNEIITQNILQKERIIEQNPHYTFYDSEELVDKNIPEKDRKIDCENILFSATGFLCPKCNQYGISFSWRGVWD